MTLITFYPHHWKGEFFQQKSRNYLKSQLCCYFSDNLAYFAVQTPHSASQVYRGFVRVIMGDNILRDKALNVRTVLNIERVQHNSI